MYQLIISEKPAAAEKIAHALGSAQKKYNGKVPYYEIPDKKIVVVPAVGHLFTLKEKQRTWEYPVFDLQWTPTYISDKSAAFAKPYFDSIKELSKGANDFVVACDYDIEGEVIGLNIIRYICDQKDAKRMKFSTLTIPDLQESYKNLSKTLDWGQAEAGETRHYLDYYYGINLSKALISAFFLITKKYQSLSIGRVQGPALAILTERELEIENFVPKTYWQIFILLNINGETYKAFHKIDKFWEEEQAKAIFDKIKGRPAVISGTDISSQEILPPVPFDLTSLQIEAYRCFGISPKETLRLAQDLYTAALISYPRTSSQQLPPAIGYKNIFAKLSNQPNYNILISKLSSALKPHNGKKTDPAHPAIYPTGEFPKSLTREQFSIYDLIAKRFIATFGDSSTRETTTITFEVEKEPFILKGSRTTKPGWQDLYKPYVRKEEVELPSLKKGQTLEHEPKKEKKQTEPSKRYTQASIIKELEKQGLGTKATRASIIDTLYQRNYVKETSIQVTELGKHIVSTFQKYAPEILSKELTRKFEHGMEKIRKGDLKKEKVLAEARHILIKIINEFNAHKYEIGKEIVQSQQQTEREQSSLMTCLKCGKGNMRIIESRKTGKRFIACSAYPQCETTWSLPQQGKLKILKIKCKSCSTPKIAVYTKGRKPWQFCPNPNCPSKPKKSEAFLGPKNSKNFLGKEKTEETEK